MDTFDFVDPEPDELVLFLSVISIVEGHNLSPATLHAYVSAIQNIWHLASCGFALCCFLLLFSRPGVPLTPFSPPSLQDSPHVRV